MSPSKLPFLSSGSSCGAVQLLLLFLSSVMPIVLCSRDASFMTLEMGYSY